MTVYKTPTAERAFIEIYKKSVRMFGLKTGLETKRQLEEVEIQLSENPYIGKSNSVYHSDRLVIPPKKECNNK